MHMLTHEQKKLATDIAQALPSFGPWTWVSKYDNAYIVFTAATGISFGIRFGGYGNEDRLTISPNWPVNAEGREEQPYFSQYSDNGDTRPGITVSEKKSAVQIAKDIERRFFPAFLPLWNKQLARVQANNSYLTSQQHMAHRLANDTPAALPQVRNPDQYNQGKPVVVHFDYRNDGGYVTDVDVTADTVSFKVANVSVELAAQIVNLVYKAGA